MRCATLPDVRVRQILSAVKKHGLSTSFSFLDIKKINPITGHYESDLPMKKCRRWFTVLSVNHRREDRNLYAKDYSNFNAALSGFSEIVTMDFFFMILTVLRGGPL
jgi:hypothetical protein